VPRASPALAPGVKYYLVLNNHRVWIVAEALRIAKSPLPSVIAPYNAGLATLAPLIQWMFNF